MKNNIIKILLIILIILFIGFGITGLIRKNYNDKNNNNDNKNENYNSSIEENNDVTNNSENENNNETDNNVDEKLNNISLISNEYKESNGEKVDNLSDYMKKNNLKKYKGNDFKDEDDVFSIDNYGYILTSGNCKKNTYCNNYSFYSKKTKTIYKGYDFIKPIYNNSDSDNNVLYLGKVTEAFEHVKVDILLLGEGRLITVDKNATFGGDNYSSRKGDYFNFGIDIYKYNIYSNFFSSIYKIYDEDFHLIADDISELVKNSELGYLYLIKGNKFYILNKNNEVIKMVDNRDILGLSTKHLLFKEDNKISLISYQDILNNKDNIINTNIKIDNKNNFDSWGYVNLDEDDEDETDSIKVKFSIDKPNSSAKKIRKVCKLGAKESTGQFYISSIYTYDLNSNTYKVEEVCNYNL